VWWWWLVAGGGATPGEIIKAADRCGKCKGEKVVEESKMIEVHVDKGMRHNQKITFSGEGNQLPDHANGDVLFVLKMKPHPRFQRGSGRARGGRDESDLMMELDISLLQALTGFTLPVTHLDGRLLLLKSQPQQIIKPGNLPVPLISCGCACVCVLLVFAEPSTLPMLTW
jgi:DnaJ family protein A protein 2